MQVLGHRLDVSNNTLGRCRGTPPPAFSVLNCSWDTSDLKSATRRRDYPSPPMSGTPPLPSKPTHESGGRARDPYQTTPDQDIYRGYAATHGDFRDPHGHSQPIRRYGQAAEGPRQGFARTDESIALSRPYPIQHGEAMVPQHSYLPLPAPLPVQPNYPVASQPPAPENPTFSSPKSQRKTKGHVASACVPCKRAHLR